MDALDRQARTAGWLYPMLVIPGLFVLIYLPSKLIVRGNAGAAYVALSGIGLPRPELSGKGVPLCAATALRRTGHHALAHHQGREPEAAGRDGLTPPFAQRPVSCSSLLGPSPFHVIT